MIDPATIERVIETAQSSILDVVSEFVHLRKRGVNHIGNCPFHDEKTPSFIVSPHKGIFKCFGCGKGGNSVNFLMEHEQLSFIEAIKYLGKKFHIHIEEKEATPEQLAQQNERESMMIVSEYASKFFITSLFETDEGQSVGLGYFKERGFSREIIKKFQLGYSPEQRDALTKQAEMHGYKLEFLEKTGLSIVREGYKGDRFRGRVIFPIHSLSGKVIAFGGRILKADAKAAKYLNSPESEIYYKSRILYGIYFARQEIVKQDKVYLVEGYTDVLSFHQSGVENVVASSGTALTPDQIKLMARFSNNITLIFDGDAAGINASLRGIDLILQEGMNVKVLLLPDGEDPDSFAKKMKNDELRKYIEENETDFIRFKSSLIQQEAKNDPIKRAQFIQGIVKTLSVIPDAITRSVYVKECSSIINVEERILYGEIRKLISKENKATRYRPASAPAQQAPRVENIPINTKNPLETEEREVLRFLLKYGEHNLGEVETEEGTSQMLVAEYIINEIKQDELESKDELHNIILKTYEEELGAGRNNVDQTLINHTNPKVSELVIDLITKEYPLSKVHFKQGDVKKEEELLNELIPRVIIELKWKMVKVYGDELRRKLKAAEAEGDLETTMELLKEIASMQEVMRVISKQQGERTII